MDPSAQAGGPGAPLGTPGSTVNPPIPTTPGTTINSNPIASLGGKIGDLATNLQKDLGKSDDDKAQPKPEIKPDIPPAPGARNISPLLGNSPDLRPADGRSQSADDMGLGPAGPEPVDGLWRTGAAVRLRDLADVESADAQRPDVDGPDGGRRKLWVI